MVVGWQAIGLCLTLRDRYQDAAQSHRHHEPIIRGTLRKHHGKMVEMTGWLSSMVAAWCRENDRFERVYPVERIVLAPSLPRVDEISAS